MLSTAAHNWPRWIRLYSFFNYYHFLLYTFEALLADHATAIIGVWYVFFHYFSTHICLLQFPKCVWN